MRKAAIIFALLIALVLLGFGAVALFRGTEPSYGGRHLSEWLDFYNQPRQIPSHDNDIAAAAEAISKLGTAALPTLLRDLQAKDSAVKMKLAALTQKVPLINYRYRPANARLFSAVEGFRVLGPRAKPAVPALIKIYERHLSEASQLAASQALCCIGPDAVEAVPTLLRLATNANESGRWRALATLGGIRAQPELVVPVLTRALSDPDPSVRLAAVEALANFGADAKSAVPALRHALRDEMTRNRAEEALRKIDPSTLAAEPGGP